MDAPEFKSAFNDRYSILTRRIFRMLSSNSRSKITDIAEKLGVSRRTVALKLANMEKALGLHYTLELDEEMLGLRRPHLIAVKLNANPDYQKIKSILLRSYIPQLAATVSGRYDLLIYANAMSGTEYSRWDNTTRQLLAPYKAEWYSMEVVHRQLGFIPLRDTAIEKAKLPDKYRRMILVLNRNSRISFQELARELKMNANTAVYNFNALVKLGYVKSFASLINVPRSISLMTFFSKYIPAEGYENSSSIARKAFKADDEISLVSRYLMAAPLIGSYDFFTIGAFDNYAVAYKEDILHHKKVQKKYIIKMLYGEIKDILFGKLPIRSVDTKSTYNTLVWTPEQD